MQVVFRIAFTVAVLFLTAVHAPSAELDERYLRAFAVKSSNSLDKALIAPEATGSSAVRCGTGIKHQLRRDWTKLESSTQKVLASVLGKPTLSGPESTPVLSSGGHFKIHYTTSGTDAPNLALINQYTNLGVASTDAWIAMVGEAFETAYQFYTQRGYRMPANIPYDVYLNTPVDDYGNLVYGLTTDLNPTPTGSYNYSYSSFIELNKDFTASPFQPTTYTPLESLQITAAHEFHHAVQFSYNDFFDFWYAEMTSTWMEDEVYDSVNQSYVYLKYYLPYGKTISLNAAGDGGSEYGRWLFNRSLVEEHKTPDVVRAIWEELGTKAPVNSETDINMTPVIDSVLRSSSYSSSLGADFLDFAKKVYTRDWDLLHAADFSKIPHHALAGSYSTYPVNSTSTPAPSVTLPRYTFAFYRFVPSPVITTFNVMITKTSGIQTALFQKLNGAVTEIGPNAGGNAYSVNGFNALNPATDEVVLLVANTTDVDNHQASFATDGPPATVTEPTVATGSGGSSGGGCFIATAAYGSYLHPKVAELRQFRDRHLLTNAPGRLFVSLYYRLSPPIAEVIAEHEWMKGGVRVLLVPVVLSVEHPAGAAVAVLLLMAGTMGLARRRRLSLVKVRR